MVAVGAAVWEGVCANANVPIRMSAAIRPAVVQIYNEMHGLIVGVGKNYCRKSQARCDECPLQKFLPRTKQIRAVGSGMK